VTKCIIVDMDGTLVDVRPIGYLIQDEERRDYDEFHKQSEYSSEHEDIATAVRAWAVYVPIVIVTARGDRYLSATTRWLSRHGIKFDRIYMRPTNDHSTDEVLKAVILKQIKEDGYEPVLAYEDNPRIIDLWHRNGIPVVKGVGW
jgi:phosphoglycolate phosphatase-like HAD superfamily hydrolase